MMIRVTEGTDSHDLTKHAPLGSAPDADVEDERLHAAVHNRLFSAQRPPARVGRFVVEERIGSGGMGIVFAARDEELHRRVAIKLLHNELRGEGTDGRARLLREARALARLSHRNVVAVHEVGTYAGRVFIAMELLEGTPLNVWLESAERSVEEVLSVMLQAGRGLAAAHDCGVLHRDIKPHNVILGSDGRVCVVDFGLATSLAADADWDDAEATDASGELAPRDEPIALPVSLTRTGAILGTPAYMSPEQHLGLKVDARSDQFSFAVMCWEALYGCRPFDTTSRTAMLVAVAAASTLGGSRRGPSEVRAALERALQADPSRRFESLQQLLRILERRPQRARRRRFALAAAPLLAASLGAAFLLQPGPCEEAGGAAWWDELRPTAVGQLAGHDAALRTLDDHASAWTQTAQQVCAAGSGADALTDSVAQSHQCLEHRVARARAVVDAVRDDASLVLADPEDFDHLLLSPTDCTNPVGWEEPLDPVQADAHAASVRGIVLLRHTDRALRDRRLLDAKHAIVELTSLAKEHELARLHTLAIERRSLALLITAAWPRPTGRRAFSRWHTSGDIDSDRGHENLLLIAPLIEVEQSTWLQQADGYAENRLSGLHHLWRALHGDAGQNRADVDSAPEAREMYELGNIALAWIDGDFDTANERLDAWESAQAAPLQLPVVAEFVTTMRTDILLKTGQRQAAVATARRALAEFGLDAAPARRAEALARLADALTRSGGAAEAIDLLEQAATMVVSRRDRITVDVLSSAAHRMVGDVDRAAQLADEALAEISDRTNEFVLIPGIIVDSAAELRISLAITIGDHGRARALLDEERTLAFDAPVRSSLIAANEAAAGDLEAAGNAIDTALSANYELRPRDLARVTVANARVRFASGDPAAAASWLRELLDDSAADVGVTIAPDERMDTLRVYVEALVASHAPASELEVARDELADLRGRHAALARF